MHRERVHADDPQETEFFMHCARNPIDVLKELLLSFKVRCNLSSKVLHAKVDEYQLEPCMILAMAVLRRVSSSSRNTVPS